MTRIPVLPLTTAFVTILGLLGSQAMAGDAGVIVDSGDPGFSTQGSWQRAVNGGADYGDSCLWVACQPGGGATATWRPKLPEPGRYAVYVFLAQATHSIRNSEATYIVTHASGEETVEKDQHPQGIWLEGGNMNYKWQLLGEYDMQTGDANCITLSNTGPEGTVVVADAVMFVPRSPGEAEAPRWLDRDPESYAHREVSLDVGPIRVQAQVGMTWAKVLIPKPDGSTEVWGSWGLPELTNTPKSIFLLGCPGQPVENLLVKTEGSPAWQLDEDTASLGYQWAVPDTFDASATVTRLSDRKGSLRLDWVNRGKEPQPQTGITVCFWQMRPRGDLKAERTYVLVQRGTLTWVPVGELPASPWSIEDPKKYGWSRYHFKVSDTPEVDAPYCSPVGVAAPVFALIEPDRQFAFVYGFRDASYIGSAPSHPCMHMRVDGGDCPPGARVSMVGAFWLVPPDELDALVQEVLQEIGTGQPL